MDPRPYVASGALVGIALAWNVWTHNLLWLWYCVLGLGLVLAAFGLARRGAFALPSHAAWMINATFGMHYIGGSLSGLRQLGGPNGLYYALPWWDNVAHALGAAAVAMAAAAWLSNVAGLSRWHVLLLSVAVATLAGVLVEIYEFANFALFGTVDQGFYTNTLIDLYNNVLGGLVGGALAATPRRTTGRSDAPGEAEGDGTVKLDA